MSNSCQNGLPKSKTLYFQGFLGLQIIPTLSAFGIAWSAEGVFRP